MWSAPRRLHRPPLRFIAPLLSSLALLALGFLLGGTITPQSAGQSLKPRDSNNATASTSPRDDYVAVFGNSGYHCSEFAPQLDYGTGSIHYPSFLRVTIGKNNTSQGLYFRVPYLIVDDDAYSRQTNSLLGREIKLHFEPYKQILLSNGTCLNKTTGDINNKPLTSPGFQLCLRGRSKAPADGDDSNNDFSCPDTTTSGFPNTPKWFFYANDGDNDKSKPITAPSDNSREEVILQSGVLMKNYDSSVQPTPWDPKVVDSVWQAQILFPVSTFNHSRICFVYQILVDVAVGTGLSTVDDNVGQADLQIPELDLVFERFDLASPSEQAAQDLKVYFLHVEIYILIPVILLPVILILFWNSRTLKFEHRTLPPKFQACIFLLYVLLNLLLFGYIFLSVMVKNILQNSANASTIFAPDPVLNGVYTCWIVILTESMMKYVEEETRQITVEVRRREQQGLDDIEARNNILQPPHVGPVIPENNADDAILVDLGHNPPPALPAGGNNLPDNENNRGPDDDLDSAQLHPRPIRRRPLKPVLRFLGAVQYLAYTTVSCGLFLIHLKGQANANVPRKRAEMFFSQFFALSTDLLSQGVVPLAGLFFWNGYVRFYELGIFIQGHYNLPRARDWYYPTEEKLMEYVRDIKKLNYMCGWTVVFVYLISAIGPTVLYKESLKTLTSFDGATTELGAAERFFKTFARHGVKDLIGPMILLIILVYYGWILGNFPISFNFDTFMMRDRSVIYGAEMNLEELTILPPTRPAVDQEE